MTPLSEEEAEKIEARLIEVIALAYKKNNPIMRELPPTKGKFLRGDLK